MDNKTVRILECTLRDGSYAIDYQFTAEDSAIIAAGLEQAGFDLIEIGHGLGLHASSPKIGIAAATDEEYLDAVSSSLKKAKFGTFFIPGIGRMEDLVMAAKYQMGFVRIGTNVTEVEHAEPFIKRAKDLGMLVSSNLMKSYALPIDDFLRQAVKARDYGADIISVVDSAGGMMPEDVHTYVKRLKDEVGCTVGFHGHNNLLLAIANSLEAVKAGAEVVDSSLQGMGRSAGNAQTEILAILLKKLGYATGIDLYMTMDLGEKVIRPMMGGEKGVDAISVILGYAQFHSSYLNTVYKAAKKYKLDPRELVIRISEVDRINVTDELAERISTDLESERSAGYQQAPIWNLDINIKDPVMNTDDIVNNAKAVALEMLSLGKKTGKQTVFTLAGTSNKIKTQSSFPFIRQNAAYIIGTAEVVSVDEAVAICQAIDPFMDYTLVDVGHAEIKFQGMYQRVRAVMKQCIVLPYKDFEAKLNALDALIGQLVENPRDKKIVICGQESGLAARLINRGCTVSCLPPRSGELPASVDVLIGMSPYEMTISVEILTRVNKEGIIIDAGPGSIFDDAIDEAHKVGLPIYRLDMRAGLAGEIINVIETHELACRTMGKANLSDISVVAGGILGKKGEIIVDSIIHPTRVIGVADGKGHVMNADEAKPYRDLVKKIKLEIAKMKFI